MPRKKPGEGKTALITGASYGIGVDIAECFAADGYGLILTARSAASLEEVAARLAARYGVPAAALTADLTQQGAAAALAAQIDARSLKVDVLVNNAGFGKSGPLAEADTAEQLAMVDLNIRALLELTLIYWPRFIAQRGGGVLNVASTAAFLPGPRMAVYHATKAFVLSLSEALWEEGRQAGVHVSCLCPGPTESRFRERAGTGGTRLARSGAMPSAPVARAGYRGFRRNRRVVVSGFGNQVIRRAVGLFPRRALLSLARSLQEPA